MNTDGHGYGQSNLRSQFVTSSAEVLLPEDVILSGAKNLCRSKRMKKATAMRWVTAPQSSLPGAPAVQGVALAPNEDVQWFWTHTPNGKYVSGYNIVRRMQAHVSTRYPSEVRKQK